MLEQLSIPKEEVTALCLSAYTNFGTTMAGLVVSKSELVHLAPALLCCKRHDFCCVGCRVQDRC